jgi:hypothetical protein
MDSVLLSSHTVVEIAAKIPEPSMQFPQDNCRVLYPTVSILYETEDRLLIIESRSRSNFVGGYSAIISN